MSSLEQHPNYIRLRAAAERSAREEHTETDRHSRERTAEPDRTAPAKSGDSERERERVRDSRSIYGMVWYFYVLILTTYYLPIINTIYIYTIIVV